MNLALRDISFNKARFILTVFGISLLIMIVMGMAGIYRGMVKDATLIIDSIGADLWIVQQETRGPFAEVSRLPASLEARAQSVPGVRQAKVFLSHTIQRHHNGRPLRLTLQGLSWPEDRGEWLPIVEGRPLDAAHYEMIADASLGLQLGERVSLEKDSYRVVGITRGMVAQGGDGLAFFTVRDALAIQTDTPAEAIRLEREARVARADNTDRSAISPGLLSAAAGPANAIPALPPPQVSAVLVQVQPGYPRDEVRRVIEGWTDVSVYSSDEQRHLLITGSIDKARRQIGLFTVILVAISGVIMSLILYTLTLDKIHDIAMLKLMGARNPMILGLILQQALLMGFFAYGLAYYMGIWLFPRFPRRVLVTEGDLLLLAGIVLTISILSSILGIAKAMSVDPNEVLA
jgi:putative ABC transport system permease protein